MPWFVFVEQLEFAAADPYQRVEPLEDGQERSQQQIHGMPAADVRPLVRENGWITCVVIAIDGNVPHPAERGDLPVDQMKRVAVAAPARIAAKQPEHRAIGTDIGAQCHSGAEDIYGQRHCRPRDGGCGTGRAVDGFRRCGKPAGSDHRRFQPDGIDRRHAHVDGNEWQQQARRAAGEQDDPVEPEPSAPTHHQQEESVEHGQQQRAFEQIEGKRVHFCPFSI